MVNTRRSLLADDHIARFDVIFLEKTGRTLASKLCHCWLWLLIVELTHTMKGVPIASHCVDSFLGFLFLGI